MPNGAHRCIHHFLCHITPVIKCKAGPFPLCSSCPLELITHIFVYSNGLFTCRQHFGMERRVCASVYRAGLYLRSLHCDRDHKYGSRVMSSSTCLKRLSISFSPHFHLSHMIYRDGCKSYLNYIFHFPYFHLIKLQLGKQQGQTCTYMLVKDRAAPQASVIRIININKKWCCVEPTVFKWRTILPLARWFLKIQFDATLCFSD